MPKIESTAPVPILALGGADEPTSRIVPPPPALPVDAAVDVDDDDGLLDVEPPLWVDATPALGGALA